MKFKVLVLIFSLILLSGCSIKREINSVPSNKKIDEVCIIENRAVKPGFLNAYSEALYELGYRVKILPQRSSVDQCLVSSTYIARWSWDLAIYMSYAKIDVFENSKLIGSALYDSTNGGGNFNKFVNGAEMTKSLVKELYLKK